MKTEPEDRKKKEQEANIATAIMYAKNLLKNLEENNIIEAREDAELIEWKLRTIIEGI